MRTKTKPEGKEWNAMERKWESADSPQWIKYYAEKAAHDARMQAKKPYPGSFETTQEYDRAYNEWLFEWSMDEPNKPGYTRANND